MDYFVAKQLTKDFVKQNTIINTLSEHEKNCLEQDIITLLIKAGQKITALGNFIIEVKEMIPTFTGDWNTDYSNYDYLIERLEFYNNTKDSNDKSMPLYVLCDIFSILNDRKISMKESCLQILNNYDKKENDYGKSY